MVTSSGECNGWPVSRQEPLDATEELVAFVGLSLTYPKIRRHVAENWNAHYCRYQNITALISRCHVSALIDKHTRYVIAITAGSVYSRCLCVVPGITLGTLCGRGLRHYSRLEHRQALRVVIDDTVIHERDF
jgi:hypothetical protein